MKEPNRNADGRVEQAQAGLWREAQAAGMSRRRFFALLSSGGAAAVLAAVAAPDGASSTMNQQETPTATPSAEETPVTTPAADRLHVKPLPENFFIPHGASIEMEWRPESTQTYTMDSGIFFIRNHSATPIIDPADWRLRVEGPGVEEPLELNYEDLLNMPAQTVTRFVECAGNGRALFDRILEEPAQGTQWTTGGYGIGSWTGVLLSNILEQAGLRETAVSIMASGLDESGFEKPLPVEKAMEDTLVIYGMNNGPLPHDHGFPARLLVPGWVGSYNVKWLDSLFVGEEQLYSKWNTSSYVLIGPEYADPEGPPEGEIIREQTVKSVVALPWPATLEPGRQQITGYAWSPFAAIDTVEVSLDGGETYEPAQLFGPNVKASGTRWALTFDAEPGEITITPRATDSAGNSQWPVEEQVWNQKGYVWGAVIPHPITVAAEDAAPVEEATPTATATAAAAATSTPTPGATATPTATTAASAGQTAGVLAMAGEEVYATHCASCHGPEGRGTLAPAVLGPDADLASYGTARGLYDYVSSTMPQNAPGSLTDQQYLEVLAYLLTESDQVASDQLLNMNELGDISLR
jgi:DMSO/TMAO reductase YedYZ molybdopterin-dependent catalytic subunit/mono/diheme cytochrome c family protein